MAFPSAAILFSSAFKADLILALALAVITKSNQRTFGLLFEDVNTSTWSPLFNWWLNGTNLPFTLAPLHFKPTSVCTANAKSRAEASLGKDFKSPLGVKT